MSVFTDIYLLCGMSVLGILMVLAYKKKSGALRQLLMLLLFQAFLFFLLYFALNHSFYKLVGIAFLFGNGTGMFQGPIIYFFSKEIIREDRSLGKNFLLHLSPYLIKVLVYNIPTSLSLLFGLKPWFADFAASANTFANLSENFYLLFYAGLSLYTIKNIGVKVKEEYSSTEEKTLLWLKYLVIGIAVLVLMDTVFGFVLMVYNDIPLKTFTTIILFGYLLLYLILGYKGVFQSRILLPAFLTDVNKPTELKTSLLTLDDPTKEDRKFDNAEIDRFKVGLFSELDEKKAYLNERLKLSDLADAMNVSEKRLSQFINEVLDVNFFTLINTYRVDEVKKKIASGNYEHMSMVGIAFDSGFQSKSSFFRIFKQQTGISPAEFKNQLEEKK